MYFNNLHPPNTLYIFTHHFKMIFRGWGGGGGGGSGGSKKKEMLIVNKVARHEE
jgi:hypothetical protein